MNEGAKTRILWVRVAVGKHQVFCPDQLEVPLRTSEGVVPGGISSLLSELVLLHGMRRGGSIIRSIHTSDGGVNPYVYSIQASRKTVLSVT